MTGLARGTIDRPPALWAKLRRDKASGQIDWHSLIDHSADVAAVFEAILNLPAVVDRLAHLAHTGGVHGVWKQRLCVLVALHDFGKANRGFQARWTPGQPAIGHIREAQTLLCDRYRSGKLAKALGLDLMQDWGDWFQGLLAILAHHGTPLDPTLPPRDDNRVWGSSDDDRDIEALRPLGQAARNWFPHAFVAGGPPLPDEPAFWHEVAGLAMLADWLGSDENVFCFACGTSPDRMADARAKAPSALAAIGFDARPARAALGAAPGFASISRYRPRAVQLAAAGMEGRIVVLESETGSGKTEAALYRFARLFAEGKVDGLYFALPTRVAATALHRRVLAARDLLFPDPECRPGVVLAVPGYLNFDGVEGRPLPNFGVQWDDGPNDAARAARWAAERPKRYLAATIAVGTIDQALLGAIAVKHAHLRMAALSRHLLVVDEVHASDRYMENLLGHLLEFHRAAGGHALLLSATLGAAARSRLIGGQRAAPPSFQEAVAMPYPALSNDTKSRLCGQPAEGTTKAIALTLSCDIAEPTAIARLALAAAEAGAKVLVIRNLRREAVAVFEALMEIAPGHPALFRCAGVPTLHHGRFALEDRRLLDAAIEAAVGQVRPAGGLVAVGTQTLEISLDIDADFLITDLAPADVLLQRLGRLHRHLRQDRPPRFAAPRAVVLAPADISALLVRARHGLGGVYGPYDDLVAVEATRRLIVSHPKWSIPAMNRLLVESATHPQARERLVEELAASDARWPKSDGDHDGRISAVRGLAVRSSLRWDRPWTSSDVVFPKEEELSTRLGLHDLAIAFEGEGPTGPFGGRVTRLTLPARWLGPRDGLPDFDKLGDLSPRDLAKEPGGFRFSLQGRRFAYDRRGIAI